MLGAGLSLPGADWWGSFQWLELGSTGLYWPQV